MLDVIITVSTDTSTVWVGECRDSVRLAARYSDVRIIEVPGVPGNIGQAMAIGFAQTTAPYVAWVDDDDFVLPNAFSCLKRHMAGNPSAIHAREIHLTAAGRLVPVDRRHHLTAYRRDIVTRVDLPRFAAIPNIALAHSARDNAVDEFSWVYVYRLRRSPAQALRNATGAAEASLL